MYFRENMAGENIHTSYIKDTTEGMTETKVGYYVDSALKRRGPSNRN